MKKTAEPNCVDLTTIGGRIEKERREKNLTQLELANLVNISRQKINYFEKNTKGRYMTTDELKNIADKLDVSTDYLLGRVSSTDINDIDVSRETGLNNESIKILQDVSIEKRSNILNAFLCNINLEELTEILEYYLTIEYITETLFNATFCEIEKKYKNNENIIATQENIDNLKKFTKYIENIMCSDTSEFKMLTFMLNDSQKEFDTISKICITLEDNNGIWNNEAYDNLNFKAYKTLNKIFTRFKETYLNVIEKNIQKGCAELIKKSLQDKNIHTELKLLKDI